MSKFKLLLLLIVAVGFGWGGYFLHSYFFTVSKPSIALQGIDHDRHYAGDVECLLTGEGDYKIAKLSICLDKEHVVKNHVVNKKKFEYAFPVATRNLSDGKHTLTVTVQDGSFNKNMTKQELDFTVDNIPLRAAFVTSDVLHKIFQGRTLHVQFQVNKPIKNAYVEALSKQYPCVQEGENSPIYECFIPIRSDENPSEHLFTIHITDQVGNTVALTNKLQVVMYPFKKQRLAIKSEKLREEEEIGLPEKQFEVDMERVTQASVPRKLWKSAFYVPCDMSGVSTAFGTLRTTQERGKYRHDAVDLLASPKSIVWASQDGIVVIKERYAHSGNTVVLDHGCGVLSAYFHLEDFANINMGDVVKKGKPVGSLGMTGYATGYHLHWEMRVNNVPVDPMQWTKHDF